MNRRGFFQRVGAFAAGLCCGTKAKGVFDLRVKVGDEVKVRRICNITVPERFQHDEDVQRWRQEVEDQVNEAITEDMLIDSVVGNQPIELISYNPLKARLIPRVEFYKDKYMK